MYCADFLLAQPASLAHWRHTVPLDPQTLRWAQIGPRHRVCSAGAAQGGLDRPRRAVPAGSETRQNHDIWPGRARIGKKSTPTVTIATRGPLDASIAGLETLSIYLQVIFSQLFRPRNQIFFSDFGTSEAQIRENLKNKKLGKVNPSAELLESDPLTGATVNPRHRSAV